MRPLPSLPHDDHGSYPIQVWYDGPNNRRRVEVMDGQDVTLNLQVG